MKRFYSILTLALVLFSFNVNGQIKDPQTLNNCDAGDVEIVIENIIWDATPADLDVYAADSDSGIGGRVDQEAIPAAGSGEYPDVFHIVEVSFERPADFDQHVVWTVIPHIEVYVSTAHHDTDVPVYVVYDTDTNPGVTPNAGGFRIRNTSIGGGISSTVAVMGRSASYEPDPNQNCMDIFAVNRVVRLQDGTNCQRGATTFVGCYGPVVNPNPPVDTKMDMSDAPTVSVYPNPVQNNLFIDNNGLAINDVSIMTLDGQVINHKASIRQGIERTQINTSQLDTGIYLLRLSTSTETIVKKIIVQ